MTAVGQSRRISTASVRRNEALLCGRTGCEQSQQKRLSLFDHLVGAGEQRGVHVDAERLGGREINNEIELGRLLDREVGWLRPPQNLVDKVASTPEQVWEVW